MTNRTWQPHSQRSRRQGFTLLELVIVMAVAGILVAVVAPSMTGVSNREALMAEGHALGAKIAAMREAALEDGLCYAARLEGTQTLLVAQMPERNCTAAVAGSGNALTMTGGQGGTGTVVERLTHRLSKQQPKITMTVSSELVWLPNGWLRGDNLSTPEGNVSNDVSIITLTDSRLPTAVRKVTVVVKPQGLICVNTGGGTACP